MADKPESGADEREHRARHDWDREASVACTISEAIAAAGDVEPTELEPLQTVVDADALEKVLASLQNSPSRDGDGRVEFSFDGYRILLTSSGDVAVRRHPVATRDGASNEEEFQDALIQLIREAEANGVAVDGGWTCRDDSEYPDLGIEIYEVEDS